MINCSLARIPHVAGILLSIFALQSCGLPDLPAKRGRNSSNQDSAAVQQKGDSDAKFDEVAALDLVMISDDVDSLQAIAEIEYKNSDFANVMRCSADFELRSPSGQDLRSASGTITSVRTVELRAAWESALAATAQCRLLGERTVRVGFSDPLAASGTYFYIFNPCRETAPVDGGPNQVQCSFALTGTADVRVQNTLSAAQFELANLLAVKESQLAAVALRLRQDLLETLDAQKSCENNEATDAVKEARTKALSSLLLAGVAASIGGAVAGPTGASTAAQRTLQLIFDHTKPGTTHNSSRCALMNSADTKARESGQKMETLVKEISQLRAELAVQ